MFKLPNRTSYLEAVARRAGLYYHGACEHDRLYDRRSAVGLLRRHNFDVVEFRRMNMLPLSLTAEWATRWASRIWDVNRMLSAIPGLNLIATNLELVARISAGLAGHPDVSARRRSRKPPRPAPGSGPSDTRRALAANHAWVD